MSITFLSKDKELFTQFKQEIITDKLFLDSEKLASIRKFPKDAFYNRGIFYSPTAIDLLNSYPYLKDTSIPYCNNSLYMDRYIYPICNTKGEVLLHMGYNPTPLGEYMNKYEISNSIGVNQRNVIANMESIGMYDGNEIYVTEGYFDAVAVNLLWNKKAIALLGSYHMNIPKRTILSRLKKEGYKLILIPDLDEAGSNLISSNLWDDIYLIPEKDVKDFNEYYISQTKPYSNTNSRNRYSFDIFK